jgi:hypothetical protein
LSAYEGDYRFVMRFRGSDWGIRIEKGGRDLHARPVQMASAGDCDLVYTTRLSYVKWALTRPYGDEILFVGSGGIFQYASEAQARSNLHRELLAILRSADGAALRRAKSRSGLLHIAKQALKRMLRRPERDLYDLNEWAVLKPRGVSLA